MKTGFMLDLFNVGYKNAYVSVMNFYSHRNNFYHRIEIFLPNVGRLCLYQIFDESSDEQIPHIDIFYTSATEPNIRTKMQGGALFECAARIIYKTKEYFETHPEHIVQNGDLLKKLKNNEKIMRKQYALDVIKYHNLVKSFGQRK